MTRGGVGGSKRCGEIRIHETQISVWEEHVDEPAMMGVCRGVLGRLVRRGWQIERDPGVLKDYAAIADRYWYGRQADLEMRANTFGRMAEFEFFQNLVTENPNGGRYDFGKFRRLPRTMRLPCVVAMTVVVRKLLARGYTLPGFDGPDAALAGHVLRAATGARPADPLAAFNAGWTPSRFARDASGWPTVREYDPYGRNRDRDGLPLRNGETRYFRDHGGRLQRGRVYTNLNEMWGIWYGGEVTYVSGVQLFHCARPDLAPRRAMPDPTPRLRRELDKATAAADWRRVATLADVLGRRAKTEASGRAGAALTEAHRG